MSGSRKRIGRRSFWSKVSPTYRMLIGFAVIAAIGLIGQTPKSIFGIQIVWPHAALWAAVGWASVGMSVRPMILLCLLGLAQDVSFNGPLAVFWIVNLSAYGVAVWASKNFDADKDPVQALLVAAVSMAAAFFVLWILASATANHAVRIIPRFQEWLITLLLFLPIAPLFRLGSRPGERGGLMT